MNDLTTWFPPAVYEHPIPESSEALNREIVKLAGHINAATYRFLKLLAVQIERSAWHGPGFKTPAHWLNYKCGIARGAAREKVRVALRLNELPQIDAAFKTGALSYSKVRAMTRVATPENERFLLMIARYGTASHIEKLVRKYERVERRHGPDRAMAVQEARSLEWYEDEDGMLVIQARLPAEEGAKVVEAIQAMVDETFPRRRETEKEPVNEEPVREESEDVSAETSAAGSRYREWLMRSTFPQKRADALVQMSEHLLASRESCRWNPEKHQIVVHIDANSARRSLIDGDGAADVHCYLDGGPYLAPQTVRRLACDAGIVPLIEDGEGQLLSIGRKSRVVPNALRRALKARDGGCRYPGCFESRFVEPHHVEHWCDGGETSLQNLLLLCRHHHRLHHEGGYRIEKAADGDILFVSAENRPIPPAFFPQFDPPNDDASARLAIERQHEALGIEIDEHTAMTWWRGEEIDYGDAVASLWAINHRPPAYRSPASR